MRQDVQIAPSPKGPLADPAFMKPLEQAVNDVRNYFAIDGAPEFKSERSRVALAELMDTLSYRV